MPPKPGAVADHVMSSPQQALGVISSEAEAEAHATEEAPPRRRASSVRPEAVQLYLEYRDSMVGSMIFLSQIVFLDGSLDLSENTLEILGCF